MNRVKYLHSIPLWKNWKKFGRQLLKKLRHFRFQVLRNTWSGTLAVA